MDCPRRSYYLLRHECIAMLAHIHKNLGFKILQLNLSIINVASETFEPAHLFGHRRYILTPDHLQVLAIQRLLMEF